MKEYQVQIGSDEYGWVAYGGEALVLDSVSDTESRAWQKIGDDKSNGVRLLPGAKIDAKELQRRLDALDAASVRVVQREVAEWEPINIYV